VSVTIAVRTVLDASPERVWNVLTDWERQATWMPDVAWIRLLGPEREIGARVAVRTKVLGVPVITDVIRVTVWDAPRRLVVDHTGLVKGRGEWRLEPRDGNTVFTWEDELNLPPRWLGDLAMRAYAPVQRSMLRRSIRNLRRLVEQ
jgi:carbon monoxide dehydrogenase subunit G